MVAEENLGAMADCQVPIWWSDDDAHCGALSTLRAQSRRKGRAAAGNAGDAGMAAGKSSLERSPWGGEGRRQREAKGRQEGALEESTDK